MKNKLVKFTIIIFVVASVAIIGGNEKAIHNSSQFNEIPKNIWESENVAIITGVLSILPLPNIVFNRLSIPRFNG